MTKGVPWAGEYKLFGIPATFEPYPDGPVHEILEEAARKHKKMGVVQLGYEMSYPMVLDHVERLATALYAMGIRKGDRIATILPTSIQFIIIDYAISRCGAVQIPSSHLEPVETLKYKLKEGAPKALVCVGEHSDIAIELCDKVGVEHLVLTDLEDYSTNPPGDHKEIQRAVWMTDLIAEHEPNPPEISFDVENDLETLLFTGGTTGLAKGCMLTHRNIYANSIQNSYALGAAAMLTKGAMSALMGLPLFHSYGHCTMHTMTKLGLRQILVPDPRDTKGMIAMMKKYRPVLQIGVPTQFMKLMDEEMKGLGILAISGSAALPKKTQDEFEKKSGGGIMEGYGLSEMSPTTHLNVTLLLRIMGGRFMARIVAVMLGLPGVIAITNFFLRLLGSRLVGWVVQKALPVIMKLSQIRSPKKRGEKRGTIGVPLPDTKIRIVDVDSGAIISWEEITKQGKTGELCLSGPQRMLGYWPDKGSGMDEDGFVHTGDVVRIDDKGYFSIIDRTKDMIVVSGFKVYSREVDEILYKHPSVEMAATVAIPDKEKEGSERVAVMIQPKARCKDELNEEEIIAYLQEKVAKYAVPKMVRFIDEMPLTEVQKVDKKRIRKMILEKVEAA
ncbi:MAG: long-chain fatty acid--CoA ligase [Deltaproteobacteria bacterium]|nr:long-chain fatty acid--CoA ligase [Deltaproteobacteria bacterium]